MSMPQSCSILIPTYNRAAILRKTLESLNKIALPAEVQVELIIVANACIDDTEKIVAEASTKLPFPTRCIVEPVAGLSVARNRCMREATGEIFAFLDDDIRVDPNWLDGLLEVYRTQPADMVGGPVELWWDAIERPAWFTDDMTWLLSRINHGEQVIELKHMASMIGANFSFHRRVAERIGEFDPKLGRTGSALLANEEADFVRRAMHAGFRAFYAPRAKIDHWVAPKRANMKYLRSVAFGSGVSMILMRKEFGAFKDVVQMFGRAAIALWCAVRWIGLSLIGSRHGRDRELWMLYYLGAVRAAAKRLLRGN